MKIKKLVLSLLGAVVAATGVFAGPAMAAEEQFFPMLVYRTGPYAPSGIPIANLSPWDPMPRGEVAQLLDNIGN